MMALSNLNMIGRQIINPESQLYSPPGVNTAPVRLLRPGWVLEVLRGL